MALNTRSQMPCCSTGWTWMLSWFCCWFCRGLFCWFCQYWIWWGWLVGRSVCERSSICGPSVLWMIQYPRVYVNCEDELHARWSGAQIRLFFAHSRKKCATHVPLSFSAISILCITLLSKTKNFYVLQCDESTTESLLNEKSYNLTLTYVASLREFIE